MKVLRSTSLLPVDLYRVPLVIKKVFGEVAQVQSDLSSSRALLDDVARSKVTNDNHESLKFEPKPFSPESPCCATDVRLIESWFFDHRILNVLMNDRNLIQIAALYFYLIRHGVKIMIISQRILFKTKYSVKNLWETTCQKWNKKIKKNGKVISTSVSLYNLRFAE